MWIIRYGGGEDALRNTLSVKRELRWTGKNVVYQLPVKQVLAMEQWHAGIIRKRGSDHVIVVTDTAYARVGIPSGKYWIIKRRSVGQRILLVIVIVATILEIVELRRRRSCASAVSQHRGRHGRGQHG